MAHEILTRAKQDEPAHVEDLVPECAGRVLVDDDGLGPWHRPYQTAPIEMDSDPGCYAAHAR